MKFKTYSKEVNKRMRSGKLASKVGIILSVLFAIAWGSILASEAAASGGKNREANPVLPPGEVDCLYVAPTGIDLTQCTEVLAPDQSLMGYFCSAIVPDEGGVFVDCSGS